MMITPAVAKGIKLGIALLGWTAAGQGDRPDAGSASMRKLLDGNGLTTLTLPGSSFEERARFLNEVVSALGRQARMKVGDGVQFGWALAAFDETLAARLPDAFRQLISLGKAVGISKSQIQAVVDERKSIHQDDQAEILMRHVSRWETGGERTS